jgi:hypothetical protein
MSLVVAQERIEGGAPLSDQRGRSGAPVASQIYVMS